MNKEQLIEEMAFIALKNTLSYTCAKQIAINFYNAGYRQIDENSVVITKAELKEYKRQAVKKFADELKAKDEIISIVKKAIAANSYIALSDDRVISDCNGVDHIAEEVADAVYNFYKPIDNEPDGAVILTPEERDEEIKACNEKQAELENEIEKGKVDYYIKGVEDGRQDFELIKKQNFELLEEVKQLEADNGRFVLAVEKFDEFARGISKTRIEITGEAIPTCKIGRAHV